MWWHGGRGNKVTGQVTGRQVAYTCMGEDSREFCRAHVARERLEEVRR